MPEPPSPEVRRAHDAPGSEGRCSPPEPLMTIAEAAAYLNIPQTTLRDYVTERLVPFTRIGRHVRFTPEHLAAIIAAGEQRPRKTPGGPSGRRSRRASPGTSDHDTG